VPFDPSCAGVIVTVPSAAANGQIERPRSRRLATRHMLWP
jgi:hypothetical protein